MSPSFDDIVSGAEALFAYYREQQAILRDVPISCWEQDMLNSRTENTCGWWDVRIWFYTKIRPIFETTITDSWFPERHEISAENFERLKTHRQWCRENPYKFEPQIDPKADRMIFC